MQDENARRQVVDDILAELVACISVVQHGPAFDPDLLSRLYLLRDITTDTGELGTGRAGVAEWINRAAMLVRDEGDRDQALGLLRRAETRLAAAGRPASQR